MTPFERALRERIRVDGALSVEAYMEACNTYYYATRDPLGAAGDFVTAPEISQMFGELVGAALADGWNRAGRPADTIYVELGPGRGTLAADALRVIRSVGLDPDIHFVETSPRLREKQAQANPGATFHDDLSTLPRRPALVVANEFFDALPIRQFVDGRERHVVAAAGGLAFDRDGEVVESSPASLDIAASLGAMLASVGGLALVIDYGHARSAPGDTLQAVRGHRFAAVLDRPGEQDLTAHVDFEALAAAAAGKGASVPRLADQGQWLSRLGIVARASALANANPGKGDDIAAALHRLTADEAMGRLFKVLGLHGGGWPAPAGF